MLGDLGRARDVEGQREPATALRKLGEDVRRILQVVDVDDRTLGGEPDRERAADPAPCAGDERDLALEPSAHSVTAPRAAEETLRAYFARTPCDTRGSGGTHPTRRCSSSCVVQLDLERSRVDVDRDHVPVANERDRASPHRLGRDVADHHAPRRAAEAAVGDEHDRVAELAPDDRRGDRQHLRHARRPGRPLVPDDDDLARLDDALVDGLQARSLGAEDPRRPAVRRALVPRELHDRALGREVAAKHAERSARLERLSRRRDHLAVRIRAPRRVLGDRPAVDRGSVAVQVRQQLLDHRRGASGAVHVARDETTAWGQARDDRGRGRQAIEVFELERDARLVRDRQQMQHGVRRAARSGDADDRVLEARPGHERGRPDVALDHVEDEPPRGLPRLRLGRIGRGNAAEADRAEPEKVDRDRHRVGREVSGAGAVAGTGVALEREQLGVRDQPALVRADPLPHVLDRHLGAAVRAGRHRARVEDQPGNVEPQHRHREPRDGLVAAAQADQAVEGLAARPTSSTESAITSRLTSDARIPTVPCVRLSETAIVLNSSGVPPAARTPAATCAASSRWPRLHGIVPVQVVAIPTRGRLQSRSSRPIARR